MNRKLTIKNSFHNSSVNLFVRDGIISESQANRSRRKLCGISGCTCGGMFGERGPQDFYYIITSQGNGAHEIEFRGE